MTPCASRLSAATSAVKVWLERDGALLRLRLARPKANIVDAAMIAALHGALVDYRGSSRGMRRRVARRRGAALHFRRQRRGTPRPSAARRCSRGCTRSFCPCSSSPCRSWSRSGAMPRRRARTRARRRPDFRGPRRASSASRRSSSAYSRRRPPACCRIASTRRHAEDLLFSGRSISGDEAKAIGLVQSVAADPEAAALAYFEQHLAARAQLARLRPCGGARRLPRRGAPPPGRGRAALPRPPDADARRERRTCRFPRQASAKMGAQ